MARPSAVRCRLPSWLKESAAIDLAQVLAGVRSAMRTEISRSVDELTIRRWARRIGCFVVRDRDGFIVLSKNPAVIQRILTLDRTQSAHTLSLGRALGYPPCCCRKAAEVGEAGLDNWAEAIARECFLGRFEAINPHGYRTGRGLISHIPCSPRCTASLAMAEALLASAKGSRQDVAGLLCASCTRCL